jgi:hypothetical protein
VATPMTHSTPARASARPSPVTTSTPPERETNDQGCYRALIFNADSGQVYINRLTEPLEDAVSGAENLTVAPIGDTLLLIWKQHERRAMRPWHGRGQGAETVMYRVTWGNARESFSCHPVGGATWVPLSPPHPAARTLPRPPTTREVPDHSER